MINNMKSYTDLEQSKKLVEILPLESADMCFNINSMSPLMSPYTRFNEFFNMETPDFLIPCWSLAALLDVLPILKRIGYEKAKPNIHFNVFIEKWVCNSLYYTSDSYDNPVDACYEMVLKLHELKML